MLPKVGALFVERSFARDEKNDPAGTYALQGSREKVIVDGEFISIEPLVVWLVIAKRNIGNGHVVKGIRKLGRLKGRMPDIRIGIELLRNSGRQGIEFNAGDG